MADERAARATRLATALRENLKRRKAAADRAGEPAGSAAQTPAAQTTMPTREPPEGERTAAGETDGPDRNG